VHPDQDHRGLGLGLLITPPDAHAQPQRVAAPQAEKPGAAPLSEDQALKGSLDTRLAYIVTGDRDVDDLSKAGLEGLSEVLRNREISPFIVNMGNNGALSNSGVFRTQPDDVRALVEVHLAQARKKWGLEDEVVDVCIYAHGGLVGETAAADIAAQWIPLLYDAKVFPIFLMWETDFFSALLGCIEDAVRDVPRTTGFSLKHWWLDIRDRKLKQNGRLCFRRPDTTTKRWSCAKDWRSAILGLIRLQASRRCWRRWINGEGRRPAIWLRSTPTMACLLSRAGNFSSNGE
jgi:hypothetical protein